MIYNRRSPFGDLLIFISLLLLLLIVNIDEAKISAATTVACDTKECSINNLSHKLQQVDAFNYLRRFGYLNKNFNDLDSVPGNIFTEAVKRFQDFFRLPTTGSLDPKTIQHFKRPRCGNPDILGFRQVYNITGHKWSNSQITYRIFNYPSRFITSAFNAARVVDEDLRSTFGAWSEVANIDFIRVENRPADIEIHFVKGDHGDGDSLDGPGKTLAHTYYPRFGGDIHFDDDEQWTSGPTRGEIVNFYQVALHEIGHALGLDHSGYCNAIMYPELIRPSKKLSPDDIRGVQAIYGARRKINYYPILNRPKIFPPIRGW